MTGLVAPSGLARIASQSSSPLDTLVAAWLAGYRSPQTRSAYAIALRLWRCWCQRHNVDPLDAVRAHVELYQRDLEALGRKPRTIYARLTAMASFYDYLVVEEVLVRDPMRGVKRPRIERKSPTAWLSRSQLADLVTAAPALGPSAHALIFVLTFNGLRIGEACSLDVDSLAWDGYSPIILFTRKGGKEGRAVLSRPTEDAVKRAIGERTTGPMLLNRYGNRMTQHNAQRILNRAMRHVRGSHGRITPHSLRHSWTTACVDAHVPVDQIQHDGGWSDPRLIPYYSHGHDRPDRAATHGITAYVMGAA